MCDIYIFYIDLSEADLMVWLQYNLLCDFGEDCSGDAKQFSGFNLPILPPSLEPKWKYKRSTKKALDL